MKSKGFRKGLSLILSVIMLFTMIPATIFISGASDTYPVMKAYSYINIGKLSEYEYHFYRDSIVTATFLDEIDTSGAVVSWDISASEATGTVMAWIKLNAEETALAGADRYDLYIGGDGGVSANANSMNVFSYFTALKQINGFENYHTGNVTNFSWFFEKCESLESVDLSSFDTSSVTNLSYFMIDCLNLKTADFSNWDTSKVTTMHSMFKNCHELVTLDLSSFDTSKVTTMQYMFYKCKKLLYIYAGDGWTTESLRNINEGVFNCCYAIFGVTEEDYENSVGVTYDASASKATHEEGGYFIYKDNIAQYKVSYEFIGENIPEGVTAPEMFMYNEGSDIDVAASPEAEGYIFSGWTTDDATVTDGSFTVNNDVHFVGSWTKLYKVEYKYDDNYPLPDDAPEIPDVELWFAPGEDVPVYGIPYVSEYVFVGWNTDDAQIIGDEFTMPEKDVTIYGYFKKPVESIEVLGGEIVLDKDNTEGEKINVYIKPEDATIKDIVYESGDESIAKVDENGVVTPVGEGTVTITVASKDDPTKSDTVTVTVKTFVTDIEVDKTEITLNKGDEDKVTGTVNEDATHKEVIYESKDETVATVDENGNIKAVGEGTTTITVSSKDNPDVKKEVTVTVKIPVTEITATEDFTLEIGEEKNLDAKVNEDATNKGLIYESSDTGVVKIDTDGNVIAIGEGTATVTITSRDNPNVTETVTVTVIRKYKVTYEFIGEVIPENVTAPEEEVYISGSDVTVEESTSAEGYEFSGWTTSDAEVAGGRFTINNDVHFVGSWSKLYNVTYEYEGEIPEGAPALPEKEAYTAGKTVDVNDVPTVDGYTFTGWTTSDAEIKDGSFEMPEKDVVLKGKFEKIIIDVEDIVVDKRTIELEPGKTDKITVTVTPDNATEKGVTYESSDKKVVTVDEEGNITAVGEGEATITVTSKDDPTIKETIKVTVKAEEKPEEPTEPEEPGYTVEIPDSISIFVGENKNLGIVITPDDGAIVPKYSSSDETVVKVDAEGNITGVAAGVATITVDFGNGDIRAIPVVILAPAVPVIPKKHYICFGKTDGIGWYEVSINGGDFFPQGPNSTLEVDEGSVLVVRVQDMWIDDEFDFYVNGKRMESVANTITVVVDGYMLIGALSMDVDVPDVEESLNIFQQIIKAIKDFFDWLASLFK